MNHSCISGFKSGIVFILFILFSCNKPIENELSGIALGTTYSITYFSHQNKSYQQKIDSVFAEINQSLSTYIPNSDISKINKGDTTVVVDNMFRDVFVLSKEIYKQTDGFFDPTVGTLVNAWGFGPEKMQEMDSTKIDSLLNYVGLDKISISADNRIKKTTPEIYLDFNAIAKGYAVDKLAEMLTKEGVENYLIEVGGELVAKGINKETDKNWMVGIDNPNQDEKVFAAVINLKDKAMASSGNYRKFWIDEKTGEKFVHTINPKTGYPKKSNVLATTVVASTCAAADAYATAFMVMELEETKVFLNGFNHIETILIYIDDKGETQQFMTEGFKKLLVD